MPPIKGKKRDQDGEGEMLSEEQRLSLLERSVNFNRIVTLVVTVVIIASLSVAITLAIIRTLDSSRDIVSPTNILRMEARITELEKQLGALKTMPALSAMPASPAAENQTALIASYNQLAQQVTQFNDTLIDQELRLQKLLRALRQGMNDLAYMVPGSRTWLERYGNALEEVRTGSDERLRILRETPPPSRIQPASEKKAGS